MGCVNFANENDESLYAFQKIVQSCMTRHKDTSYNFTKYFEEVKGFIYLLFFLYEVFGFTFIVA